MLDMILKEYLVIFTLIQTKKEPVSLILHNYLLFDLFLLFILLSNISVCFYFL